MASFDQIINAIIPYIIGIIGLWLFIRLLGEPLKALWNAIKSLFKGKEDTETSLSPGSYIQYE